MPASAPGYAARPEDAQCYNCGTSGHWAIACPEPTRETPAGLAAWRSTNNMGKGHNRDQHGGSKKAKGPIITKYAPPPSSAPTMNRYGPPPGYGQPPAPYPGPAPPYPPQYPPHSAPPPGYPPGYSTPSYPPQPYPPPSYGSPPLPPPGPPPGHYGLPPPPLPPPPHHAPHPAGPPPSYPPAYGPPPTNQPPQPVWAPPPPRPGPPPGSSSRLSSGSPPISRHGPPTISTLPTANKSHPSLPPRPPQSNRSAHEPSRDHRDHRNKKKHDRHNRNRDNRHKKGTSHLRPSDHKAPDHKAEGSRLPPEFKAQDASKPPPSHLPEEQPSSTSSPKKTLETPTKSPNRRQDGATESTSEPRPQRLPEPQPEHPKELGKPLDHLSKTVEAQSNEEALLNVPDSPHLPDKTESPSHHSEEDMPPLKWDADGDGSKSDELIENVEEFFKLLHDNSDPPFVQDDGLRRNSLPKSHTDGSQAEQDTFPDSGDVNEHLRKHVHSGDHTPEKRPAKRQRSISPPYQSPGRRETDLPERPRDSFVPRPRKVHRSEESDQRITDLPHTSRRRSPDRRRSHEREPSRSRSLSSRRSSVSVASSGLDSLEAELLGRPDKARTPEDINKRRETHESLTEKLQANVDTAVVGEEADRYCDRMQLAAGASGPEFSFLFQPVHCRSSIPIKIPCGSCMLQAGPAKWVRR
ncbi:hypothetical protein B0J13DRAFT_523535 [Dactylonectria estremocensis]|uniref:CCHC-type domain-containing protein n=1 Tax=Dactylonectria estremocensis TaxID=1079267 RepID=A0A9P9F262_9HYPO|nr:hypothetical protein B0J13DRAFT_523535 [Dactylonectria estremocensis]